MSAMEIQGDMKQWMRATVIVGDLLVWISAVVVYCRANFAKGKGDKATQTVVSALPLLMQYCADRAFARPSLCSVFYYNLRSF